MKLEDMIEGWDDKTNGVTDDYKYCKSCKIQYFKRKNIMIQVLFVGYGNFKELLKKSVKSMIGRNLLVRNNPKIM